MEEWNEKDYQMVVALPKIVGEVWALRLKADLSPMKCVPLPNLVTEENPRLFLAQDWHGNFDVIKRRRYVITGPMK